MNANDVKKDQASASAPKQLVTVGPKTRLEDALALMSKHRIHHLPVLEHDRLVGVLIDRDVLSAFITEKSEDSALSLFFKRQLLQRSQGVEMSEVLTVKESGNDPASSLVVERYMQRNVPTIDESTDIREALNKMLSTHFSALPILRSGKLAGIITETDMLRLLASLLRHGESESVVERGEAILANPLVQNVLKTLSDIGI